MNEKIELKELQTHLLSGQSVVRYHSIDKASAPQTNSSFYDPIQTWLYNHSLSTSIIKQRLTRISSSPAELRNIKGQSLLLEKEKRPYVLKNFLSGYGFSMQVLWPATLAILLAHDLITFAAYPSKRFDTTLEDIFFAGPKSGAFISNMGSDLYGEASYFYPSALLLSLPIITGLLKSGARLIAGKTLLGGSWRESLNNPDELMQYATSSSLWPHRLLRKMEAKKRLKWAVLWEKELSQLKRDEIVEIFLSLPDRNFIKDLMFAFSQDNLDIYARAGHLNSDDILALTNIRQKVEAKFAKSSSLSYYGKLLTKSLVVSYSTFYYFAYLARKISSTFEYFQEKNDCHDPNTWAYIYEKANYVCSLCGDWPFVYLGNINSAQGCLDGLIKSGQDILNYNLSRLANQNTSILDLSILKMSDWSDEYFEQVFNAFKPLNVQTLNVSSNQPSPNLTTRKAAVLNQFIRDKNIKTVDLSGLHLGANKTETILDIPSAYALDTLLVSRNDLGSQGADVIHDFIADHNVSKVDVSFNNFRPADVLRFSQAFPNSTLTDVRMQNVVFDQVSFDTILGHIAQSPIRHVDFSNSNLALVDMTQAGEQLMNSQLESLILGNCRLNDNHVISLSNHFQHTLIKRLNLGNNSITSSGGIYLVTNIKNSSVSHLILNRNQLRDAFLTNIKPILPSLNIVSLDLSGNSFSSSVLGEAISFLPSSLKSLYLGDTSFDDTCFEKLSTLQNNGNFTLEEIDISYTRVTDDGITSYSPTLGSDKHLKSFSLQGTHVYLNGITSLSKALEINDCLERIDVSRTFFNPTGAGQLTTALSKNKALKSVRIADVPVGDAIFELKLIEGKDIDYGSLRKRGLSRDERLALNKAVPTTHLRLMDFRNANLSTDAAIYLCHVLPQTQSNPADLKLDSNAINIEVIDPTNCVFSSASQNEPWGSSLRRFSISLYHSMHSWFRNAKTFNYEIYFPGLRNASSFQVHCGQIGGQAAQATEYSSINIAGTLLLVITVMTILSSAFRSNMEALNEDTINTLQDLSLSLKDISAILRAQSKNKLGCSGIFNDRCVFADKKITETHDLLKMIFKNKAASRGQIEQIKSNLTRLFEIIKQNKEANKQYKKILLKEGRAQRRNEKTGRWQESLVTRNVVTGELTHEIKSVEHCDFHSLPSVQSSFFSRVISQIMPTAWIETQDLSPTHLFSK